MLRAIDVAKFFISLDKNHELFDKSTIELNGKTICCGNLRLNKYLHMAQNLYIAKTGELLIDDPLYAYENGAVMLEVQQNYVAIVNKAAEHKPDFPKEITDFLTSIYQVFKNATVDELIELSHEDAEWQKHRTGGSFQKQKMDSLSCADEYKKQYHDILKVMERNFIKE